MSRDEAALRKDTHSCAKGPDERDLSSVQAFFLLNVLPRDERLKFSSQRVLPEFEEPHRRDEYDFVSKICWVSEVQPDQLGMPEY